MEINELMELLDYAEKLKDGIDPTTGIDFTEDTILKSPSVRRYNQKVAEILKNIIRNIRGSEIHDYNSTPNRAKIPYTLSIEKKQAFLYAANYVSISKLVYHMNSLCEPYMRKIRAVEITEYLQKYGYLKTEEMDNGRNYKVATERGHRLGIVNEKHTNKYGNDYSVNMYDKNAQKFIVNNIEKILRNEEIKNDSC